MRISSSSIEISGRYSWGICFRDKKAWRKIVSHDGICGHEVLIKKCRISSIDLSEITFSHQVIIEDCKIDNLDIVRAQFAGGLIVRNCIIRHLLIFESGMNVSGKTEFTNNVFTGVVNVSYCLFSLPIVVEFNEFKKGHSLNHLSNIYCDGGLIFRGNVGEENKEPQILRKAKIYINFEYVLFSAIVFLSFLLGLVALVNLL